jgi:hypothetical protein
MTFSEDGGEAMAVDLVLSDGMPAMRGNAPKINHGPVLGVGGCIAPQDLRTGERDLVTTPSVTDTTSAHVMVIASIIAFFAGTPGLLGSLEDRPRSSLRRETLGSP